MLRTGNHSVAGKDQLPPHCPEAEKGVLGCCLLDASKTIVALRAGMNSRWFFDSRHAEIFKVVADMALNGGGDSLTATVALRESGKLEAIGGIPYLHEIQNFVPSAENIGFYIPELQEYFRRRQILDASGRLGLLARDPMADPVTVLAETQAVLEFFRREADETALPDIIPAGVFLSEEIEMPRELVRGVLHQGSKLILGGSSKSYKTWALLDLAVSVATGTPWLGLGTDAGRVLYVNLEIQPAFFRSRVAEVARAKQVTITNQLEIWNLRGFGADYHTLVPKIRQRVRDQEYALVILDPTYKLLGEADENSASDITALLNALESLGTLTGAAVALAGHFAKGNAAAKESIDRISGSGVFARDPDSLITFTRHEEDGAFTVELTLRNLPPLEPFVVAWDWPLFHRDDRLDPAKLRQTTGRPALYTGETLLECLGSQRLTTGEWKKIANKEHGVSASRFFVLQKQLQEEGKIRKSIVDGKWEKPLQKSGDFQVQN